MASQRTILEQHGDDSGNYLAGFFDDHRVSDANILAANLVFIVQRCAGDRASTKHDRLEFRNRRQHTGAPDLNGDGTQARRCLLGSIFPRPGPFWRVLILHLAARSARLLSLITAPSVSKPKSWRTVSSSLMAFKISSGERQTRVHS